MTDAGDPDAPLGGRPRSTSPRELEVAALQLFAEQGFDQTTVDDIAAAAAVSRRTFFRYFDSKPAVLWGAFDDEVQSIRARLSATPVDVELMTAVRQAVVAANHYRAEDIPELRLRMQLIITVPALAASSYVRYEAWERAVSEFAASRLGQDVDALVPLALGRATLAVCRAAYDRWMRDEAGDLPNYLDQALRVLAAGFGPLA